MRKERSKRILLCILGSIASLPGCISLHQASSLNCCETLHTVEPHFHGVRDAIAVRSHRLPHRVSVADCAVPECDYPFEDSPLRGAAASLRHGVSQAMFRVHGWKAGLHSQCSEWWADRKEKRNPPPWPKFHPLPTKPAFEPQAGEGQGSPGIFGAFGAAESD